MLAIAEKGIDANIHHVDLLNGEQLTQDYRAINPTCDLPAIVHDGKPLGDSVAILKYLEDKFPTKSLTPKSEEQIQAMNELLEMASKSHMDYIVPWLYAKGFGRLPTPEQKEFYDNYVPHRSHFHNNRIAGIVAKDTKAYETMINRDLLLLESNLSKHQFLVGDSISLADMAWFPNVYLLVRVFAMPLKNFPCISRWMDKMEKRPAFINGIKAHMKPIPFWLLRLIIRLIRLTGGRK